MELACKIGLRIFLIFFLVQCYPESDYVIDKPSANLSALDVVELQLKALQNNNFPQENAGIKVAYSFASPYQRAESGPFNRYEDMYLNKRFKTLINSSKYYVEKHYNNDTKAEYFVFVTDKDGNEKVFLFRLSRQTVSPYTGCWMTDSIMAYADPRTLTGEYYIA